MATVINAAFPVFALILLGFIVGKRQIFASDTSLHLNAYVVWLALPALMFHVMASVSWSQLNHISFVLTNLIAMLSVYGVLIFLQYKKLPLSDNSISALTGSYSNSGYMGFPLCLLAYGQVSMLPAIISMIMTVFVLFSLAVIFVEVGVNQGSEGSFRKILTSLLKNPIVIAPILGALVSAVHIQLPQALMSMLKILGDSASPCALVTIGLFLAQPRKRVMPHQLLPILIAKLLVLPLITAILAFWVFKVPTVWAKTAVVLAALPVGTGPFMLAAVYNRDSSMVSQAIFISTMVSAVTVSLLLFIFH